MPNDDAPPPLEHQRDLAPGRSKLSIAPADPLGSEGPGQSAPASPPPSRTPGRIVRRAEIGLDELVEGVREADRSILGRAITLIESSSPRHARTAQALLTRLMPHTGVATRVGITGVPGVGKSTFIEQLGMNLIEQGRRVAVLAVDPTSGVTGGSILGDKTRMARLGTQDHAFIRPSPAGATLGGVARKTRETLLVCEAAGFDIVLVETVGVGQSETVVAEMTDFFLALMLAGAGDELQGIKRGLVELADLIAINKADGDNEQRAKRAAAEYRNALHYMHPRHPQWQVPVMTCSAVKNIGLDAIWEAITEHRRMMLDDGTLAQRRQDQLLRWMWKLVDERLAAMLREHPAVAAMIPGLEAQVRGGELPPTLAAHRLLEAFSSAEGVALVGND